MNQDTSDLLTEPLCTAQQINLGEYPESQCERIRNWAKKCKSEDRQIFCEMLELCRLDNDDYYWYEQARWIKYEETVEGSKERWSKPHIPLLNLQSLMQLKNCLKRGVVLLDLEVRTFPQLVDKIIKEWENEHMVQLHEMDFVKVLLLCNKEHLSSQGFLRKKLTHFISRKSSLDKHNTSAELRRQSNELELAAVSSAASVEDLDNPENDATEADAKITALNIELSKKLSEHAEVAVMLIGKTENVESTLCAFARLKEPMSFPNFSEVNRRVRFIFVLIVPEDHDHGHNLDMIGRALASVITDDVSIHIAYEAEDIFDMCYGIDEFMSSMLIIPPGKWGPTARLEPTEASAVDTYAPRRSRFMTRRGTIRRKSHESHFEGLQYSGRICGGIIDDIKRKSACYVSDFVDAVNNWNAISQCTAATMFLFFANLTNIITFGGVMGGMLKDEMAVMECIVSGFTSGIIFGLFSGQPLNILSATGPVLIFETLFYKFCLKRGWLFLPARFWLGFWSSVQIFILVITDASFLVAYITRFTEECFATLISIIFIVESIQAMLNLATNAPITPDPLIVMNDTCRCMINEGNETDPYFSVLSNITSPEVCTKQNGTAKGLMCTFHPDVFMFSMLLFLGTFALATILHSFRSSRFFPTKFRSVISDFAVLIAICFMTLVNYFVGLNVETLNTPTQLKPTTARSWVVDVTDLKEWWIIPACFLPALLLTVLIVMDQQITAVIVNRKDNKLKKGFGYHLDLLLVGFLIIICSLFGLPYFVAATILSITHVQSLRMVSECAAPGEIPLFLGVRWIKEQLEEQLLEEQVLGWYSHEICCVLSNSNALDLDAVRQAQSSDTGLCNRSLRSVLNGLSNVVKFHTIAFTQIAVPLCKREQRLTTIIAHILIGLSIFLAPVQRLVPTSVLYGVFLFMGVSCLSTQQFVQRILLFLTPVKYQPDFGFLRVVTLKRVFLFTILQLVAFVLLCVVKYTKQISMLFPILLIVLVGVRKGLDRLFTQEELAALDDVLPLRSSLRKINKHVSDSKRNSVNSVLLMKVNPTAVTQ